jgi:uncharacterized protein (TIGR00255 family)
MTVYSMTGFATATHATGEGGAVTVEARSVNGRFLDVALRLPDELRGLEPSLRELLGTALRRGKVELRIATAGDDAQAWPRPDAQQLHRLAGLQATVLDAMPQARPLSVDEALRWCRGGAGSERIDEPALAAARECIEGLRAARGREGTRLVAMLRERLARLRELAAAAGPLVPAVVQRQQQRFLERWAEAVRATEGASQVAPEALQERAMAEAAAYAIRIDVAEELSRLGSHLEEIERLLSRGGEVGKRLDFLIQELQREANTLGSKSAALELTGIAVDMKVAIEQMREQVQNIE